MVNGKKLHLISYCNEEQRQAIVQDYYAKGLTKSTAGVFVALPDWIGHYNVVSFEKLDKYLSERNIHIIDCY